MATRSPGAAPSAAQKGRDKRDLMDAVADAVDELCRVGVIEPTAHQGERVVTGLRLGQLGAVVDESITLEGHRITSIPRMYGRSTSGTSTEPSG